MKNQSKPDPFPDFYRFLLSEARRLGIRREHLADTNGLTDKPTSVTPDKPHKPGGPVSRAGALVKSVSPYWRSPREE
ncbi:MAG: hypothetical protein SFU56_19420 [Capsulimonadales bacterium]|nr:hypothetical protein [Capsulimonadales bacterium]